MDFATLHKQRKLILIAAGVGIISIFLPWVNAFIVTINGFHGKGIIVFLAFVGAIAVALTGDKTKALDKALWVVALATGAVALLFTIIYMADFAGIGSFGAGMGAGVWLALLSSAGVLAAAWLLKTPGDDIKSGFESLKTRVSANLNTTDTVSTNPLSKVDELEKLIKLRDEGKITEEEYQQMKAKIM